MVIGHNSGGASLSCSPSSASRIVASKISIQFFFNFFHGVRNERESSGVVNGVNELLLLRRRLPTRLLHLNCQKAPSLWQTTDDVGNASGVCGDVGAVRLTDA